MRRFMRNKAIWAGLVGIAAVLTLGLQAYTAPKKPQNNKPALRAFMRGKLDASQKILEGLCTEDYELIGRGAQALQKIGGAEEWRISNDPVYSHRSAEFLRVAERLKKAAEEKKLDSVALTWVEATMSCIECHRWVRAEVIAQGARPAASQIADLDAIDVRLTELVSRSRRSSPGR